MSGCDSIIETTISVGNTYLSLRTDSVCLGASYTFGDGFMASNIVTQVSHTSNLTTILGCDSIVSMTVNVITLDTSVTSNGFMLTASAIGVSYQWIDCYSGQVIGGATNATFSPQTTGSYACIVGQANCSDSSACQTVIVMGFQAISALNILVFPNPNQGDFVLQLPSELIGLERVDVVTISNALPIIEI